MPRIHRDDPQLDRRSFVKLSLFPAAFSLSSGWTALPSEEGQTVDSTADPPEIVDTNVFLFDWPFRRLKYARTERLVEKLRRHRITQAWAGSFEAVFHKQLDAANRRLAEECRLRGEGLLLPFGSVNPAWSGWQDDLRRCREEYGMPGIRLYPGYHGYALDDPQFVRLLQMATDLGLLVQIALRLEDERVHHPLIEAPRVAAAPLVPVLKDIPAARVQLVHAASALRGSHVPDLVEQTTVTFDISNIEGNGGVGRLIDGNHWYYHRTPVPAERLLFGSHAPFFPVESALLKLFESPLSREQLQRVMSANAGELLEGER